MRPAPKLPHAEKGVHPRSSGPCTSQPRLWEGQVTCLLVSPSLKGPPEEGGAWLTPPPPPPSRPWARSPGALLIPPGEGALPQCSVGSSLWSHQGMPPCESERRGREQEGAGWGMQPSPA